MKRADVLWHYDGSDLVDVTYPLGEGVSPAVLAPDDHLYVGSTDWLSGLYVQVDRSPAGQPEIVAEMFDGATDAWRPLPLQERVDQTREGYEISPRGYDFLRPGVVYWGTAQWMWVLRTASVSFPVEGVEPPECAEPQLFWVRLRNVGQVELEVARVLPSMYNTYATHQAVAQFIGVREFTDLTDPLQDQVRRRIRAHEDWLDTYTRWSWRPRARYNERYTFNPYGIGLRGKPVWFVSKMGVWTGAAFTELRQGRQRDFYVSDNSMVYFTRIALGRGLPWSNVSSRYLRLPDSLQVDYVYGEDFDLSQKREIVSDIVVKRVAADIVMNQDWTAVLVNSPDAVPKPEKARQWMEQSEERASELRSLLIA